MKQRLGIALALIGEPDLLILDEPTNGLDPEGIHEIRELIKELPKINGMSVLISSHILSEIQIMADDIGIINLGKLLFQGSLDELLLKFPDEKILRIYFLSLLKELLNYEPAMFIKNRIYKAKKRIFMENCFYNSISCSLSFLHIPLYQI